MPLEKKSVAWIFFPLLFVIVLTVDAAAYYDKTPALLVMIWGILTLQALNIKIPFSTFNSVT